MENLLRPLRPAALDARIIGADKASASDMERIGRKSLCHARLPCGTREDVKQTGRRFAGRNTASSPDRIHQWTGITLTAGQQAGPVDDAQLAALVSSGKILNDTLVWREGMDNWRMYGEVKAPGLRCRSSRRR